MNKKQLRRQLLDTRLALPVGERHALSRAIVRRLLSLTMYREAGVVHSYLAVRGEVETGPFVERAWRDGKRVVVPVVDWEERTLRHSLLRSFDDLEVGRCGLREPRPSAREDVRARSCDLILVPGIAYDRRGARIGYGEGYYDRFLDEVSAPKIAPLFSFQLVDRIEREPWDIQMDLLVTEDEIIQIT